MTTFESFGRATRFEGVRFQLPLSLSQQPFRANGEIECASLN
jgi:hypothetical protein